MRVHLTGDDSAAQFASQLLDVGNGELIASDSGQVTLPFGQAVSCIEELITKVFPALQQQYLNEKWLCERTILAPRNVEVNEINQKLLEMIPGESKTYTAVNNVIDTEEAVHFPPEFLNSLDIPGLPPHNLLLKIGAPIMLLRNLNPPKLCNGTRLSVKRLMNHAVEATILTGKAKGENVFIPKIPLIPSDTPFQFKRLQLPVRLSFAMTINKSQGQSLGVVGLSLGEPVFFHMGSYMLAAPE
jgi:ATP-dependent DNA helicase PIF1